MKTLLKSWNAIPSGMRVLVVALIVLITLYAPYVVQPNNYLFGGYGDGLKNYYSASYFVRYDNGAILSGMNYPHGEVITFADGQLGLTFILQRFERMGLPVSAHLVGILNLLMLLSLVASQYLLYRILRHYSLPFAWAVTFGILIGLVTPQIERWTGHFGLGYLLFIPLIWWLYIKGREAIRYKWFYPLINILAIGYFSFLHPYYLALSLVFFLGIALAELIGSDSWRTKIWRSVTWALVAIVPFLIVQLIMTQIDPVSDRPKAAWGIHYYRTDLASLFFLPKSEIFDALQLRARTSESQQYFGLVNGLMIVIVVIMFLRVVVLKKWQRFNHNARPTSLNKALIAGTLAILFALGLPFVFGLEWVTDWIYPLTQFRAVARFAWLFYITFSVFTVREIYKWWRTLRWRNLPGFALGLVSVTIVLWSADALIRNRINFWNMNTTSASWYDYNIQSTLEEAGYSAEDFQAILPVPYFNVGNEIWGFVNGHYSVTHTFRASYQLHLPMLTNHAARISQSQSMDQLQLFSNPRIYRELPRTLPLDKPLLLLVGQSYKRPWEARYQEQGTLIKDQEEVDLYELPVKALWDSSWHYLELARAHAKSMIDRGTFFTDSLRPWVYYDGFEDENTSNSMLGDGSFWARSGENVLCSISPNFDSLPVRVEISLWRKSYWRRATFPDLLVRRYNRDGRLIYEARYGYPTEGVDIYKDWFRFACSTDIEHPGERIEVVMNGSFQMADELLIRPKNAEVWTHVADSGLTINNYPVYPRFQ